MPKKPHDSAPKPPSDALLQAAYNSGVANGRIAAIEESMDAIAKLIAKAETMIAQLPAAADPALRANADHTLRALQLAFAAITGSVNGSPAYRELLEQSRLRLQKDGAALH